MHVENIYNNRSQNNEIRKISLQNTALDIMTMKSEQYYMSIYTLYLVYSKSFDKVLSSSLAYTHTLCKKMRLR